MIKLLFILLVGFTLTTTSSFANSIAEYEARRQTYLLSAAPANDDNSLVMQAYLGLTLNQDALDRALSKIMAKKKC